MTQTEALCNAATDVEICLCLRNTNCCNTGNHIGGGGIRVDALTPLIPATAELLSAASMIHFLSSLSSIESTIYRPPLPRVWRTLAGDRPCQETRVRAVLCASNMHRCQIVCFLWVSGHIQCSNGYPQWFSRHLQILARNPQCFDRLNTPIILITAK